MNELMTLKKNAKTAGCRGTLANANDLPSNGLIVAARVALGEVNDPGGGSKVGNRGPRPEITRHICFDHPIS